MLLSSKWFLKWDNREIIANPCKAYVYRVCPWTSRLHQCRPVWRSHCSRCCSRLSLLCRGGTCSPNYSCRTLSRTGRCSESLHVCSLQDKRDISDRVRKEGVQKESPPLLFTRLSACVHKSSTLILPTACILSLLAWTEGEKQKQQNDILIRVVVEGRGE